MVVVVVGFVVGGGDRYGGDSGAVAVFVSGVGGWGAYGPLVAGVSYSYVSRELSWGIVGLDAAGLDHTGHTAVHAGHGLGLGGGYYGGVVCWRVGWLVWFQYLHW